MHYLFFTLQRSAPRVRGAETVGADPAMLLLMLAALYSWCAHAWEGRLAMRTGSPLLPQDAETLKDRRLGESESTSHHCSP